MKVHPQPPVAPRCGSAPTEEEPPTIDARGVQATGNGADGKSGESAVDAGGRWLGVGQSRRFFLMRVQTIAVMLLALFASLWALSAAREIVIPIVVAVLLAGMLSPIVNSLRRLQIPRVLAAALVVGLLVGLLVGATLYLATPAQSWINRIPEAMREAEFKLRDLKRPIEALTEASKAAENLTDMDGDRSLKVTMAEAPTLTTTVLQKARGVLFGLGLVVILLFFILAYGTVLLRNVVRVTPLLQNKKRIVEIVRRIHSDVSRYILTAASINLGLGAAVAVAMHLLDMPNPILWGVMAATLNFIPYLGAIVGIAVVWLAAIVAFDDAGKSFVVAGTYFALTALEGQVITPMIHGHRLLLNPIVIFLSVLFWSWLWGVPGALLAVPILAVVKIVCDRCQSLQTVGVLLGR